MSARLNDAETEKLVLDRGLMSPEKLAPFRVQASVDSAMLFDLLVTEGVITTEILAELEKSAPAASPTASGSRPAATIGFLKQHGAPTPAAGTGSGTAVLRRSTRRFDDDFGGKPTASSASTPAVKSAASSASTPAVKLAPPVVTVAAAAAPPHSVSVPPVAAVATAVTAAKVEIVRPALPAGWPGGVAPADASPGHIQQWLAQARTLGASDLYCSAGVTPAIRVNGELKPFEGQPALTRDQVQGLIVGLLAPDQRQYFEVVGDLTFSYAVAGAGRYRASVYKQREGNEFSIRIIPDALANPGQLGLPEGCEERLAKFTDGLLIFASPAGQGKTASMFAIVDVINAARSAHIMTLEQPIEYVLAPKASHISQRDMGLHSADFETALNAALLEDPDVIVIGELRDHATVMQALGLAEAGLLVVASVSAGDCARAIDRLMDSPDDPTQLRNMMADNVRAILAQQLIPLKEGHGRVAACEILINSISVSNIIREAKTQNLINVMQTGKSQGMMMMDDSLRGLVEDGVISGEEAFARAKNKAAFKKYVAAPPEAEPPPEPAPAPAKGPGGAAPPAKSPTGVLPKGPPAKPFLGRK